MTFTIETIIFRNGKSGVGKIFSPLVKNHVFTGFANREINICGLASYVFALFGESKRQFSLQ